MVYFGTPLVYFSTYALCLSIQELAALAHPRDYNEGLAEQVALKIFAKNAKNLFGFALLDTIVGELDVSEPLPDRFNRILFKETNKNRRDNLGADGVVIYEEEKKIIRLQLKLGKGNARDVVKTVISRFSTQQTLANELYRELVKDVNQEWTIERILITTKDVDPNQQETLKNTNIGLINKKQLQQIWPTDCKVLGAPYSDRTRNEK